MKDEQRRKRDGKRIREMRLDEEIEEVQKKKKIRSIESCGGRRKEERDKTNIKY